MKTPLSLLPPGFLRTVRSRLLVLVTLVVLPALSVQVYGAWRDLHQSLLERQDLSSRAAAQARSEFDALLDETRIVFVDLVQDPQMRSPDNCTQIFTSLRFAYERLAPDITNLGLADSAGDIYCAINPVQSDRNIAAQAGFTGAVESLDMSLGVYVPNPATGSPFVSLAYPVLSFDGEVQTVIFATFETRWLEAWQEKAALPAGVALTLLSPDGRVLWRTVGGEQVQIDSLQAAGSGWFSALQAADSSPQSPDLDGIVRLNTFVPLNLNARTAAYLHLGYPVEEIYAQAYRNLYWKLGLLALVFVAAMGLAWWGSETLFLRPLKNLMAAVARVQTGDLRARAAMVGGLAELTALAQSFDAMTDALERREAERRQMEERFRTAFESSAIGMALLTLTGDILAANPAVCAMSGYTEDELKQRNDSQNVYPPDAQAGMDLFQEMLAGKLPSYRIERRYLRKNGEIFWTQVTLALVRDAQARPAYLVAQIENIDEQKRKSVALADSEARFRTMFETSAIGIGLMGLDRRVIDINPALCQMYGYTRQELLGQMHQLVVHPDDLDRAAQDLQALLAGKFDQFSDERRYLRKDGSVFWARVSMSMVRDARGAPLYIVGMVADINEERLALARLQESEARFRAMYENAAIGICLIAPDGHVLAVNPVLVRLAGRTEAELLSLDVGAISYPEDTGIGLQEFSEVIAGTRDSYQVEKRYVHVDGRIQWMRQSVSAVRDSDGKTLYLVVIAEDIDERKRAVQELLESEARFRSMFENAAVGVAVMSLDRRITQINQTAVRLTGYSLDEISRLDPSLLAVEEDRYLDRELFIELVAGTRDQYTAEKRYIRKDGSLFWGRINFSVVRGVDGSPLYLIGIIEDITEEKRAAERLAAQDAEYRRLLEQRIAERTEELNLANERLREKAAQDAVTAERTRLARDLHDAVTQTLFSATLIADVLPDIWELNPGEGRRRLEEVRQLTRGALAEMRTLLVELRPNALVEVPLPVLLRQLTEALAGRSRMDIQLNAGGGCALPADVQVSLYRIAQEALNNVVKHARASQAVVTLRLEDPVRLVVADNGAGFDPSTITADHLGLKIMRERADAIGAKLTIYSESGEGTQVSVVWPLPGATPAQ